MNEPRHIGSNPKVRRCVIEFQAFRGNGNEYIVKELVIWDLDNGISNYFLFKPPFSISNCNSKYLRVNKWLSKYYHHIKWDEGFVDFREVDRIMFKFAQYYNLIYTTGTEKLKWISKFTNSVIVDFSNSFTCLDFKPICIAVECGKHKVSNCSLSKAYQMSVVLKSLYGSTVHKEGCDEDTISVS